MMYCYRGETGRLVERIFDKDMVPWSFMENGERFSRDLRAERKGFPPTTGWPIESVASGVHPDQADKLRKHLADNGVPTDVTDRGNPVYRDSRHQRKALKVRGLRNRASFVS